MSFAKTLLAMSTALVLAVPAFAEGMTISDAYMRTSGATAKSGAAFMLIFNDTGVDDRLIGVASDVAAIVEMHTHNETGDGVMQMLKIEGGIVVPAAGTHALARGGDHVMFMGLTRAVRNGDNVTLTLTFENAGEMVIELPVDQER